MKEPFPPQVYVNGKKFTSFRSRSNVDDIKTINVCGEAYIYRVKLQRVLVRAISQTE